MLWKNNRKGKEFKDAKDEFKLIFDGTGTKWIKVLSKPEHMFHELFDSLKGNSTEASGDCWCRVIR
ncbi:MAG: hypothetical protein WA130_05085 [Candidatus Methanoperedens sp.]